MDLTPDLEHGLVLIQERDGFHFEIGRRGGAGGDIMPSSPHAGANLGLRLVVPPGGKEATIEWMEWQLPGHLPIVASKATATLHVLVEKLEPIRGGVVALRLGGDMGDTASSAHVAGDLKTFARDIVRPTELLGADQEAVGR